MTKISNSTTVYLYKTNGTFVKITTIGNLIKASGESMSSIDKAVNSFKGYGYIKPYYISLTETKIKTDEEVMTLFSKWCDRNLNKCKARLKSLYSKQYDDDAFQEAAMYVIRSIHSERSINDPESAIMYKYKTCKYDIDRLGKTRKDNGLMPDIDVVADSVHYGEQCDMSYIGNFAEESYFDSHIKYNCVDDVNNIKRLDVLSLTLKEELDYEKVDLFITILQTDLYDFTSETFKKPEFKTMTLVRRYKDYIVEMRNKYDKSFKGSNSAYLEYVFNECWTAMIANQKRIKSRASVEMYRDVDDYTLFDFINN